MAKAFWMVLVAVFVYPASSGAQSYLAPTWTKTLAKGGRFLVAQEDGRCTVVDQKGVIEVIDPSGAVAWRWGYQKISRLIYPQETAVSPDCDAIAITGSTTYKYTWLVERSGKSVSIGSMGTPSDVMFDHTGERLLIGTFTGMLQMHARSGDLLLTRAVRAPVVIEGIEATNDGGRVAFSRREGKSVTSEGDAWLLATADDAQRRWLASAERIACLDRDGNVLAEIAPQTFYREVFVSRDFAQVVKVERAGSTTRLYGYAVAAPCKP